MCTAWWLRTAGQKGEEGSTLAEPWADATSAGQSRLVTVVSPLGIVDTLDRMAWQGGFPAGVFPSSVTTI